MQVSRVDCSSMQHTEFLLWIYYMNSLMFERASEILDKNSFDLIHAHDWMVARAALKLKNSFNLPLITTIHATEIGRASVSNRNRNDDDNNNEYALRADYQRIICNIEYGLIKHSDRVICCSNYMLHHIHENFHIPANKIDVIPNAVDITQFNVTPKIHQIIANLWQRYKISPKRKVILYVGRLVQQKGVHILLDAFEKLNREKIHNLSLIIVGEGPLKKSLLAAVNSRGLQENIHLIGFVDESTLLALYRSANICVIPSIYEPFGIVALEAMASGVPIVVSNVGGLSEIVENGITGLEFSAGDANSLVAAIRRLLEEPLLAESLTQRGYNSLVVRGYDWDLVAKKTIQIYNQAIYNQAITPQDNILSYRGVSKKVLPSYTSARDELDDENCFLTDQGLLRLLFTMGATKKESPKTAQEISSFIKASPDSVKQILGKLASQEYVSILIMPTIIDRELKSIDIRYYLTERGIISACADFS
jgi:glycogen synthase